MTNGGKDGIMGADNIEWGFTNMNGTEQRNFALGLRNPPNNVISDTQIESLKRDINAIKADITVFNFNKGRKTAYNDDLDIIFVKGDVFSDGNDSENIRDKLSARAVLAHEYYGHRAYRGTSVASGAWNDEFRASYMAAKNSPGLSAEDRYNLVRDAIERAKSNGVSIKYNDFMRRILYG
ncbi:hypothetical protein FACS189499_10040 [Clostridia bacterium]|nr:hypothetical protein FACS189499_10040 [Clostridia bacterium]